MKILLLSYRIGKRLCCAPTRVLIKVDNSAQKSCFTHLIRDNRLSLEKGEKEKEKKKEDP